MKNLIPLAFLILALEAGRSTGLAQAILLQDDFTDANLLAWTQGVQGQMTRVSEQLVLSGTFGATPPAEATATYVYGIHSIPTSGPLPDGQTLEARVELLGINQNDAFAHLQLVWFEGASTHAYALVKDQDEIGLMKAWDMGRSLAFLFFTKEVIKSQNVTLVLALTRRGSNLEINTRVLDRDNSNAVLFDRTVTDTPQSDAVLATGTVKGLVTVPDRSETPWPVLDAPGSVELGMAWGNTQHGSVGPATATFDNLEVKQYESPELTIQRAAVLSWPLTQAPFAVVSAPSLDGPWTPVTDPWCRTNASRIEVIIVAPDSQKFFQLR